MIINLSFLVIIFAKVTNSVPGFEFEDNRAAKYLTDKNGVAEITFQERIDNFRLIFLINPSLQLTNQISFCAWFYLKWARWGKKIEAGMQI